MTEVQFSKHYDNTVNIKFYPVSHRYQLEGQGGFLISVTAVTGLVDKSGILMHWATRLAQDYLTLKLESGDVITVQDVEAACAQHRIKKEEAADTGTAVHTWIQEFIAGNKPVVPEDEQVKSGVLAFLKWKTEKDIHFVESEKRVYSKLHDYVGNCDIIFTVGNDPTKYFGDFKTSKGVYPEFWMQIAAYRGAYEEEFGGEFGDNHLLHFNKETGNFAVHTKSTHEEDYNAFLGLLATKKWLKKNDTYNK